MSERRYSWPEGHWGWPVALTHKHGVRAGKLIFTGGQVDLTPEGEVCNPGNLSAQTDGAMAYLQRVLEDLGADFNDLIRLVVYFVGDAAAEAALVEQIARIIGPGVRPAINLIGLPELCYPRMMVEIEGVAMRGEDGAGLAKTCLNLPEMPQLPLAFSHAVICDGLVVTSDISALRPDGTLAVPGDVQAQTREMMDNLGHVLAKAGANFTDVLKLNTFYTGNGTAEDWEVPARIRASYFPDPGPAPTGMPVPSFPNRGMMAKIAVTAMQGAGQDKRSAWPEGHWDWTTHLPYMHGTLCHGLIHVGGQVSLDASANVIDPGNMVAQTHRAMDNVAAVLAEFGASLDDVLKVTTFYQGNASAEDLHENLLIRSGSYTAPGPATTGIPMPALVYEDMMIEIEVIAQLPNGS